MAATPTHRPPVTARLAALTAVLLLAAVVSAAPAAAQQAYPPEPEVAVTTPGATIVIRGTDWGPDTEVEIDYGAPAAAVSATVGPDGQFAVEVPVPADAQPGAMALRVTGTGSDGEARRWEPTAVVLAEDAPAAAGTTGGAERQVASTSAPADVTPAAALPTTGSPVTPPLLVSALLLAVGAGLVHAARVRTGC